jgi:hypothetical protein
VGDADADADATRAGSVVVIEFWRKVSTFKEDGDAGRIAVHRLRLE